MATRNKPLTRRNRLFWFLLSIFTVGFIGAITTSLYLYEGNLLNQFIKENRAELKIRVKDKYLNEYKNFEKDLKKTN